MQRWVDLLAALLRRSFPATFAELARDVPAYADRTKKPDAIDKMFERDKEDLRAYGVPIRTETSPDGTVLGYRLDRRDFYLPYIALAAPVPGAVARPARARADFYRALSEIAVDGGALALVAEAARRVEAFADPQLAAEARAGARKLAFDQPTVVRFDAAARAGDAQVVDGDRGVAPKLFEALGEAVLERRAISFEYRTMATGETHRRRAEPYGLHLTGGHWYLVGRDRDRAALRTFRVSRIAELEPEKGRSGKPGGFDVPADFRLRDFAGDRRPWALGDAPAQLAVVEFLRDTGAAVTAMRLGERVDATDDSRAGRYRYEVRRTDAFMRWLLALAGDAVPVSPPTLVAEYRRAVGAAASLYRPVEGGV